MVNVGKYIIDGRYVFFCLHLSTANQGLGRIQSMMWYAHPAEGLNSKLLVGMEIPLML